MNPKLNPYPNMFMLNKKYNSINDVRLFDVLEAFPLSLSDPQSNYLLRFESIL
jgi:hypothetical protein